MPHLNHMKSHLPAFMPACLHACLHACLLACLLACMFACMSACLPACLPACLLACLHSLAELFEHHWVCQWEAESFGQNFKWVIVMTEPIVICLYPACLPAWMPAWMLACLHACLPSCLPACLPALPACMLACFACLLACLHAVCLLACFNSIRDELFAMCSLFVTTFHTTQLLFPTVCFTLPYSVRDEKFGNIFVHCRSVYVFTQIMIRVYGILRAHSVSNLTHLKVLKWSEVLLRCSLGGGHDIIKIIHNPTWGNERISLKSMKIMSYLKKSYFQLFSMHHRKS